MKTKNNILPTKTTIFASLRGPIFPLRGALIAGLFAAALLLPGVASADVPPAIYNVAVSESGAGGQQYFAPGSYSYGGASGTVTATPTLHAHANGVGPTASTHVTYYFQVSGPDSNTLVPVSVSYNMHCSGTGDPVTTYAYASSNIRVTGFTQAGKAIYAANQTGNPNQASFTGTISVTAYPNNFGSSGTVELNNGASSQNGGDADSYLDPYVFIDPAWADANPGYSVTLSAGIGNSTPGAIVMIDALSQKTHGGAGTFNIHLPLTGEPGVECRSSGGNHTLVFTFTNDLAGGSASVTSGAGLVVGNPVFSGKTMTVNLSAVGDMQKLTVTLSGVTDVLGHALPTTNLSVNMLIGDTNGNKTVNASDIGQTKSQSGQPVTTANFRTDVNASGTINASDIGLVKASAGHSVP